jgi:hypothetical protein
MSPRRCRAISQQLAAGFGERLAGIVLCVPTRLDPVLFAAMPERLLMISGEGGLTADVTSARRGAAARLAARRAGRLRRAGWADVVADRTDEIVRRCRASSGR